MPITSERQFIVVDTGNSAEHIVENVMHSNQNQLLSSPRFSNSIDDISPPVHSKDKVIGLFSSGTTGNATCIWNSYRNLLSNARVSRSMFNITEHQSILIIASPWHVAGLTWALMAETGNNLYHILSPRKKEASRWPRLMEDLKPDVLLTVPSVLRMLYKSGNWFVPNIICGGEPLTPNDYPKLRQHGQSLYQAYGQTEAGGLIAVHRRDLNRPSGLFEHQCCGYPVPDCKIRCEGTTEAPASIYLKSPFSIYTDWYDTGDLGFMDSLKRLYISGRDKN